MNSYDYRTLSLTEKEDRMRKVENLDKDLLFRYSFVPFCLAEGAWDYADSVIDIAIVMRLIETRPLSRAVRQIRSRYDRMRKTKNERNGINNTMSRNIEINNFLSLENDWAQDFFKTMSDMIKHSIANTYPDLDPNHSSLVHGVYICHVLLQCIFRYTHNISEVVRKELGFSYIADILPKELYNLDAIILEFAGDKRLEIENINNLVNEFAEELQSVELIDVCA